MDTSQCGINSASFEINSLQYWGVKTFIYQVIQHIETSERYDANVAEITNISKSSVNGICLSGGCETFYVFDIDVH